MLCLLAFCLSSTVMKLNEQSKPTGVVQPFLLDEKGKRGHRSDRDKLENRLFAQSMDSFLIYFTVFFPSASLH